MEQGSSAHLRHTQGGALVPAETYIAPLLPYERHLIQTLGVTEQEYRDLVAELQRAVKERGEEYAHIPDVRNDALTVAIISLALGLVSTAISLLLAPKPPEEPDDNRSQKNFGDQQGRSRFNNSVGFDGAPQLAQLASRVPLPFGRYQEYNEEPPESQEDVGDGVMPSGGMVVEPLLVWSRMQSNGGFQSLKALMVLGQSGIETPPNIEGVMLGGQPIANFYKSNYAVFWSSEGGSNLLNIDNVLAGEASPQGNWLVPTGTQENGYGFSAAYSPSNTTEFGVYESIYNGGHFRLNWRVVSVLSRSGPDDPSGRPTAEIAKIAGNRDRSDTNWPMRGIGRCYSNFCGLIAHNGQEYQDPTVVTANRGDRFTYRISSHQITQEEAITVDRASDDVGAQDINNALNSRRERCDTLLVVGQTFLCNRTLMRVVSRPTEAFDKINNTTLNYELEVISFIGGNREVGLAGRGAVENPIQWAGSDAPSETSFRSVSWYPLHRVDVGQIKNTRPVEVTELGLRSQVWTQINGLCSFSNVPTPDALNQYNQDEVQVNAGVTTKYAARISYFTLAVKEIGNEQGLDSDGNDVSDSDYLFDGFDTLNGIMFGVRGSTPIDVYNFIRIKAPRKGQYEYRLIPKDACTVHRYDAYRDQQVFFLDIAANPQSYSEATIYGTFQLKFHGRAVSPDNYMSLDELRTDPESEFVALQCSVQQLFWRQVVETGQGGGRNQAYLETILGQLKDPTNPGYGDKALFGERRTRQFSFSDKGLTFNCEMDGFVEDVSGYSDADAIYQRTGTMKKWIVTAVRVLSVSGRGVTSSGEIYNDTRTIGASWHAHYLGLSGNLTGQYEGSLTCVPVNTINNTTNDGQREFEAHAQIKELSCYDEITRSCESRPEHSITYINESLDNLERAEYTGLSMVGIKLRSLNQVQTFAQPQIYLKDGISIPRFIEGDTGPSNNFADIVYWLLSTRGQSIGREISTRLLDRDAFADAAKFYEQTRCRFDGAITDQVNIRSYITQIAPLFVSNFVIKNGKFALVPAVPVDSNGELHTGAVEVDAHFNNGNIIDGSFELNYLAQNDRQDFRCVIQYREQPVNGLAQGKTIMVRWKDQVSTEAKQETIDAQAFITRRGHAFFAARYLLSVRRRVDHVISFKTTPTGISLAPGSYIRFDSNLPHFETSKNVAISSDLEVVSPTALENGTYTAYVYRQGSQGVVTEDIEIINNKVTDASLRFALLNIPRTVRAWNVYQVDEVTLDENGLVEVKASHFPVYDDMRSKIVDDLLHAKRYEKFEVIE